MFELHITCSKDFDKLSIDFSDGTTIVQENKSKPVQNKTTQPKKEKPRITKQEKYLDTDAEFGDISQEIVKPPDINRENKQVKVADELQNMNF